MDKVTEVQKELIDICNGLRMTIESIFFYTDGGHPSAMVILGLNGQRIKHTVSFVMEMCEDKFDYVVHSYTFKEIDDYDDQKRWSRYIYSKHQHVERKLVKMLDEKLKKDSYGFTD